jgi:hypothetical protein
MRSVIRKSTDTLQPPYLPECNLWLDGADASTQTISGTNVTQWRDKSGKENHGTTTGGTTTVSTLNSVRALSFNATSSFAGAISNTTSTVTAFMVATMTSSTASYGRLLSCGLPTQTDTAANSVTLLNRLVTTNSVYSTQSGTNTTIFAISYNTPFLITTQYSGTQNSIFLNGTQQGNSVNVSGTFAYTRYRVGDTAGSGAPAKWAGLVGEIIIYNASLTPRNRQIIEGYLAWKWGMQTNLPSTHPYRLYAPSLVPPQPGLTITYPLPSAKKAVLESFQPSSISGCFLWLDGTDSSKVGVSGTNVTAWNDKSGLGNNLTTISSTPPTYTAATGAIRFTSGNGTSIRGALNKSYTNPISTFIVCSIRLDENAIYNPRLINFGTNGSSATYFAGQTNLIINASTGTTPGFAVYANNGENPTGQGINVQTYIPTTFSTVGIFENLSTYSGTTLTLNSFLNGNTSSYSSRTTSWTVSAPYVTSMAYVSLGTNTNGSTYLGDDFGGDIYEVICFSRTVTTSERQQIEGYLAWKYNLQANLPANHPFKGSRPTPYMALSLPRPMAFFRPGSTTRTNFFYTTGVAQTFTVPSPATVLAVYLWGAGGGRNATTTGAGAFVSGTIACKPGDIFQIVVGRNGNTNGASQGTIAQGGGGRGAYNYMGGGGFSGIFSGTAALSISNLVAIAGGAGSSSFAGTGGSGGVINGKDGTGQSGGYVGTGGTQTAGGTGGPNTATWGQQFFGGSFAREGPGGGGGYFGGGGSDPAFQPGQRYTGSGGGSSYTGGFTSIIATQDGATPNSSTTTQPGGTTNEYYISPWGAGLQHGLVVVLAIVPQISWT